MSPTHFQSQYQRPQWGRSFVSTAVGKLIIANVAVFILQQLFRPYFDQLFALQPRAVVENFYIWKIASYMFLHGNVIHILFNMIVLFFLGTNLEMTWGANRFLKYYIACGVGAGLLHMLISYNSPVIGASGATYGLMIAFAILYPNQVVLFMFVFPVKIKYLVAGFIVFDLLMGVRGGDGIAHFAHLGGALTGLLFFRKELGQRLRFSTNTKRKWKAHVRDRQDNRENRDSTNIDSILDKISAKGYDNLTTTEKRILENYSRKRNEESDRD
jgi:membrane associated rhomboid family serine protease